jgi:hypothetical protein
LDLDNKIAKMNGLPASFIAVARVVSVCDSAYRTFT